MSYKEILEHFILKHEHEAKDFLVSVELAKMCLQSEITNELNPDGDIILNPEE